MKVGRLAHIAMCLLFGTVMEPARALEDEAALPAAAAGAAPGARTITHADLEAKYADSDSRFTEVDEVRIHYKDSGRGPAILLIHGSMGDVADWDGWVSVLRARHRVVRLDLPGFGLSGEIANNNYSIDHTLSLLDGLMDALNIPQFAIVGTSYGGPVAFRYAATRVDRVTALVIMNSAGIEFGKQRVDPATGKKEFYQVVSGAAPVTREFVEKGLSGAFNDAGHIPAGWIDRKLDFLNAIGRNREGAIMVSQYVRGNPEQVLAHVRAPTLVLWGAAERSLSLSTADRFVAALTHAGDVRKALIDRGDHAMHIEWPKQTAHEVEQFLDGHISPRHAAGANGPVPPHDAANASFSERLESLPPNPKLPALDWYRPVARLADAPRPFSKTASLRIKASSGRLWTK